MTGIALVVSIALGGHSAVALDITPLWTANPDMIMEGAPIVVDLNADGNAEVLTAAYEALIAVGGDGKELWRFDTRGRYSTCPAVLEREAGPLIFAGDNTGLFTCLDGAGRVVWQAETKPVFCSAPALADLNGDGKIEVVQGDKSGAVNVFDALTGTVVWKKEIEGECSSPAIADLDSDGSLEIVIATGAGKVFALDASGNVRWEFALGGTSPDWATCSPILFGDSKGGMRVAASGAQRIFCLDNQGGLLWERSARDAVASSLSAGDYDADGRTDLFAVTQLGVLYRFDEDGRVLWDIDTQGRGLASGAIIDLDGDGRLEYALCTQQGNLLVFDNTGEIVFNHQFDNRTINVTPAFGDIVKDRSGLEFAITGGESGQVFCFGTPAPVETLAEWRTYRCDNRLTGTYPGPARSDKARMTPENLNWDQLYTGEDITFRIAHPNPGTAPLKAEASCVRPDGSRQAAVGKVVGGRGLLKLPVAITAPGVYRFAWALKDGLGGTLAAGARELTLQPYQNDQAMTCRAILALEKAADLEGNRTVNGLRVAMLDEANEIKEEMNRLALLQVSAPGPTPVFSETLDAQTAAFNARAKRALALAHVAPSILANAPVAPVIAFEGVMWENRDMDKQVPSEVKIPLRIARRCVIGEHEPVSIKLLNVTTEPAMVNTRIELAPDGPKATPFEVKSVPTNQGTAAWDPIVPLGENALTIPSLETREIWLDIDLAGVKPGTHAIEVVLSAGRSDTKVEITLDVLPFEMAGFGAMRLCCWATYTGNAVEDLLAHGNNVFITGLPGVDGVDGVDIAIDFAALDTFVAPLADHDVFLLLSGVPSLGVPVEEGAYVPRLADYLEQVMARLKARGFDEDRVALYPYDEPGGQGWDTVNRYIAFARQGLKARPGLKFYVDGGGDLPMFEAFNEVAAIWCPGYYMLAENTPVMEFLRKSGKALWSYDCGYAYSRPIGSNTKGINIVAQYRLAPAMGFHFGATGIGYWCYNIGPSLWEPVKDEYAIVYANPDGTQTSCRRWEAVREGMEDTRILIALRDKLADPSVSAAAKEKIRHLLDETLARISRQDLEEARLGVARYVLDASNNDATVEELRAEIMGCVASL